MPRHDAQNTGDASKTGSILYQYIQVKPTTEFSQYDLQLMEVYNDNTFPSTALVQFNVSAPSIASLSGNRLTFLKNGRVTVSLDYTGIHFEKTIFGVVSPDNWEGWDNNTKANADFLFQDKYWKGDMIAATGTDTDYYQFTLSQDFLIQIGYLCEGEIAATKIQLYDASDTLKMETVSYVGQEKVITASLSSGTYYIKLMPYNGYGYGVDQDSSYYIGYTVISDPVSYTYPLALGETKTASIYSQGDRAVFQFQLATSQNIDILLSSLRPGGNFQADLTDSNDTLIKRLVTGTNNDYGLFSVKLNPGTYKVRVTDAQNTDTGHHPFSISLKAGTGEYETESNDSYDTATPLSQNIPIQGILYDATDKDFFAFSLDVPQFMRLDFSPKSNDTKYNLTLYKISDQNVMDATVCEKGATAFIETGLTAGNYLVKVETVGTPGYLPAYNIRLSQSLNTTLEIEPNNTAAFANAFDSTHPRQGRIYSATDTDYYAFSLSEEAVVSISFVSDSATADYTIIITYEDGTALYQKESVDGADILLERRLVPGKYFVKIQPKSGGNIDPNNFYHLSTTNTSLAGLKSLVSITVSAPIYIAAIGGTLQMTATGNYSDATRVPIFTPVWSLSDSSVAIISQNGVVTGISDGYADIYASFGGKVGQIGVKVGTGQKPPAQSYGNLIVLAGGGGDSADPMKNSIQYLSDLVYLRFTNRNFTDKDIYYFNSVKSPHDLDGDGFDDNIVDDSSPTAAKLGIAITGWAKGQNTDGPLYLADHRGTDSFRISATEVLTASQLKGFIDTFQTATGRRVIVIIEACKSGTFTDNLVVSGQNRVVITSTGDQNGYMQADGRISFTQFFTDRLLRGDSVYQGWTNAKKSLTDMGIPYSNMQPKLVEGIASASSQTVIGGIFIITPDAPTFSLRSSDTSVPINTAVTLFADVTDINGIESVWAVVTPPDYVPPVVSPD